ncbi:hypothetical protein JXB11_02090 [Candidatus Woesearchaeota archaeon]|nr:hypothetical protein [Candidatus Woesearchaeota archaeon]
MENIERLVREPDGYRRFRDHAPVEVLDVKEMQIGVRVEVGEDYLRKLIELKGDEASWRKFRYMENSFIEEMLRASLIKQYPNRFNGYTIRSAEPLPQQSIRRYEGKPVGYTIPPGEPLPYICNEGPVSGAFLKINCEAVLYEEIKEAPPEEKSRFHGRFGSFLTAFKRLIKPDK